MAINLPKTGYDGMVLINQLANNDKIRAVTYSTKNKDGVVLLKSITAHVGGRIVVNPPGPVEMAHSNMTKMGGNGGG